MKKILVLSMLFSFVMICSCQKKGSADQQQLAQRKTELDTREEALAERKSALDEREKALDERQKALDEREKALAQKGKAAVNAATNPTNTQVQIPDQTPDPAQAQAVREMIVRQLSPMIPERSKVLAEKAEQERVVQEQRAQSQPRLDGLQSQTHGTAHSSALSPLGQSQSYQEETLRAIERQRQAMGTSGGAVFPSPAVEATSPSPSPAPQ